MKGRTNRTRTAAILVMMVAVFLLAYFLPFDALTSAGKLGTSTREALLMLQDYARHHVLLCLVPALFIAGAIACFVSQGGGDEVLRRAGAQGGGVQHRRRCPGRVLAACSCTVLPLFAGIYTRGAGLGPAVGVPLRRPGDQRAGDRPDGAGPGLRSWVLARAVGAMVFSVVIGVTMHLLYRKEEAARDTSGRLCSPGEDDHGSGRCGRRLLYFAAR
jgi:uncharacterized membrane protein YraQ (UPF0718 family)